MHDALGVGFRKHTVVQTKDDRHQVPQVVRAPGVLEAERKTQLSEVVHSPLGGRTEMNSA